MRFITTFIGTILLIACVLASILFMQGKLSELSSKARVPPSMAYLPQSEKIKPWLLGFHTVLANYLWIKTTIYFGGHSLTDGQYPWLIKMIDIVTRLNPRFYPAYEFGGLLVPEVCHNPDAARIILERGTCHPMEKKWKLYFFLGMLYYKYYHDNGKAGICFAVAAQLPGAQVEKLTNLARHFFMEAGAAMTPAQIDMLMYSNSENPEVRRFMLGRLRQ